MADIFSLDGLFTLSNLFTLLMLVLLQAVLGFDNLLYITIESRRVPAERQRFVRRVGIGLAVLFRLVLLFVILLVFQQLQDPLFSIETHPFTAAFTVRVLITLFGGAFIIWTAMKEIFHLLSVDHLEHEETTAKRTVGGALFWIVTMNLIFSFDSLLSAIALSEVFVVLGIAIVAGGALMVWLSDHVAAFLEKNRAYEVLGLFILLVVGVLLLSDAGHLAHMSFFGFEVQAMSKATFYFVIFVMVCVSVVQSRYRTKLLSQRSEAARMGVPTTEPNVGISAAKG
ncbi:TerC family protein [Parvularcula dongshanensis]|uniref:Putative tellurium resistance membrane protein TerC n=1 Tax=Parvularcula dongshanensis TaxID=1173995 RepID=A0A840I3R9_9PROT|nr:tellurium resistance protein TerC [Parvularcula dongshanensis]MBB4658854.1 putative tellurium resistance membrane protein TerC [Parvularcula dongshanensis]